MLISHPWAAECHMIKLAKWIRIGVLCRGWVLSQDSFAKQQTGPRLHPRDVEQASRPSPALTRVVLGPQSYIYRLKKRGSQSTQVRFSLRSREKVMKISRECSLFQHKQAWYLSLQQSWEAEKPADPALVNIFSCFDSTNRHSLDVRRYCRSLHCESSQS